MNGATCPVCPGNGVPLGALGTRMHYRCRDCGMDFSKTRRVRRPRPTKARTVEAALDSLTGDRANK
jgi:tRNA(Ile2) C34 agmatinyltransferase TiaS